MLAFPVNINTIGLWLGNAMNNSYIRSMLSVLDEWPLFRSHISKLHANYAIERVLCLSRFFLALNRKLQLLKTAFIQN